MSITLGEVLRRTDKAISVGATPTWFADHKNPLWAFRVPHVETNERLGMNPGTWTVATGPRMLESERCRPGARVACPRGPNWCGRTHLLWVPMLKVTVDAVVEMVPAGGLVPVVTGTRQGTILARPMDRDSWWEEHPPDEPDGILVPRQRGADDGHIRHRDYPAAKLRARLDAEQRQRGNQHLEQVDSVAPVVTDAIAAAPTVLVRMLAASLSEDRARQHLAAGRVLVDGEPATAADHLATPPARIVRGAVTGCSLGLQVEPHVSVSRPGAAIGQRGLAAAAGTQPGDRAGRRRQADAVEHRRAETVHHQVLH